VFVDEHRHGLSGGHATDAEKLTEIGIRGKPITGAGLGDELPQVIGNLNVSRG
jgi:hypothetical protein